MKSVVAKQRESNIELLRIISMMMVVVVHADGAALGLPKHPSFGDARDVWRLAVETIAIIGVNCFTLISGYFGIRLRVRTVFSYLFQCVFYAVGIATIAWWLNPAKYSFDYWAESWMVLTHTDLWYVPAYFMLMLVSPVINGGMERLSRRKNLIVVGLFVIYNIWGGWMWGGKFNPTGYTIVQLIMVYMVGRLIAMYPRPSVSGSVKWGMIYLISMSAVFISAFYLPPNKAFAYNSPAVMLMSVSFFICFLGIRFKSPVINYFAQSAFAVYLVHKAPAIWCDILKPFFVKEWMALSLWEYTAIVIIAAMVIYLAVMIPDFVRRKLSDGIVDAAIRCQKYFAKRHRC